PGAFRTATFAQSPAPLGRLGAEFAAAAAVLFSVGRTYSPAGFWTFATVIAFSTVYASSTYPTAPGVWRILPATPAFWGAPMPVGHLVPGFLLVPTVEFHVAFTFER